MNRSFQRRFGAVLILSLSTFSFSLPRAHAADATPQPPADAAKKSPANAAAQAPADAAADTAKPAAAPDNAASDPAAPRLRHGARSKATDGSLLVWDNVSGVFVSPDQPNTCWVGERFYQYKDGVWLTSAALAGPWTLVAQHMVPDIARNRHGVLKESVTTVLPSGREAVFEPRLKVFKIAGKKGVFLFDAGYYRYDNGVWLESTSDEGPWTTTSSRRLPGVLRNGVPLPEPGTKVTLPSGETLVSEGDTGMFAVDGKPDAVYFDGSYYERRETKWFVSDKSASGFEELPANKVPGVVRNNYHKGKGSGGKEKRAANEKAAGKDKAAAKKPAAKGKTDATEPE